MRRVWVVEDNDANYELVEYLLAEAGWRVDRARDSAQFSSLLGGDAPDAILLDMHLPDVPGLELLRLVRSIPGFARVPVVALTAHAMRGDRERFLAAGCDGYLSKPIDTSTFVEAVESLLGAGFR